MEKKPRVIKPEQAERIPGHCGRVTRLISSQEATNANFDHVEIDEADEHWHEKSTEYYYVLKGEGAIYLNKEPHKVYKGCLVEIPPGVKHMAETGLEVLVVGVPPVKPGDVHYKKDKK